MNKLTIILIILVVLLVGIGGGAFYWFKMYSFFDISKEAVRNACEERISQATDEELIKEVKNLEYPEEIDIKTGEKRITSAHKQLTNYFYCKVKYTKDEGNYNLAKNFISELAIQEENKKAALVELENSFSENEKRFKTVIGIVAFEPFESLCLGDQATEKLLESSKELIISTFNKSESVDSPQELSKDLEERLKKNSKICSIINKYSDNTSSFIENEIRGDWSEDDYILENMEMPIRLGISFRLGGRNLAMETCNSIPDSKEEIKKNCLIHADYMEKLSNCIQSSGKGIDECKSDLGCAEYKTEMVNLICAVDIE